MYIHTFRLDYLYLPNIWDTLVFIFYNIPGNGWPSAEWAVRRDHGWDGKDTRSWRAGVDRAQVPRGRGHLRVDREAQGVRAGQVGASGVDRRRVLRGNKRERLLLRKYFFK